MVGRIVEQLIAAGAVGLGRKQPDESEIVERAIAERGVE